MKSLVKISLIFSALSFTSSLNAEWMMAVPDIYATWTSSFVIPVYATFPEETTFGQITINLCDDQDSLKFIVDSFSLLGNGFYTTVCDTCIYCGFFAHNITQDPYPTSYVTIAWLIMNGYVPPIDSAIIGVIWAHAPTLNPSTPEFDTIELYLSITPGCPPPPDTLFTFHNGNIYIVPSVYTRGDVNASGGPPDLADALYLISHILDPSSLPCQRAADCNLDGDINVADVIALVNYLYMGGTLPEPSYPNTCGYNFQDTLPCDEFPPCGYGGE
ncbi:MAG: hypothetical protein DRQ04_05670 [Candidatus Hydrothermota bacterium]|nr:MAG: hypothetical protein DRQ04_05670 [Candidatus Hydrothermae bacterium]